MQNTNKYVFNYTGVPVDLYKTHGHRENSSSKGWEGSKSF